MKGGSAISSWVGLIALFSSGALSNFSSKCNFSDYPLLSHQRYVSLSVPPDELNLGMVPHLGSHDSRGTLRMHVATNLNYSKFVKIGT